MPGLPAPGRVQETRLELAVSAGGGVAALFQDPVERLPAAGEAGFGSYLRAGLRRFSL